MKIQTALTIQAMILLTLFAALNANAEFSRIGGHDKTVVNDYNHNQSSGDRHGSRWSNQNGYNRTSESTTFYGDPERVSSFSMNTSGPNGSTSYGYTGIRSNDYRSGPDRYDRRERRCERDCRCSNCGRYETRKVRVGDRKVFSHNERIFTGYEYVTRRTWIPEMRISVPVKIGDFVINVGTTIVPGHYEDTTERVPRYENVARYKYVPEYRYDKIWVRF